MCEKLIMALNMLVGSLCMVLKMKSVIYTRTKKWLKSQISATFPYFSAGIVHGEISDPNRDPNRKRETKEPETTGAQRIAGFAFLQEKLVWVKMRARK